MYAPHSLNELLNLKKSIPDLSILAGGTWILGKQQKKYPEIDDCILIKNIPELRKISRTERFLEIGAGSSVNRILNIGQHILPPALHSALESIGPFPLRNTATLGGNIAVPHTRLNSFPVLLLLDSRIELRRSGGSRWVPISRLFDHIGTGILTSDEIITRIRIPLSPWNNQFFYRNTESFLDIDHLLICCGICNVQKRVLTEIRFTFQTADPEPFRSKEMEANLEGKKIPLTGKDQSLAVSALKEHPLFQRSTRFLQYKVEHLFNRFLSELQSDI